MNSINEKGKCPLSPATRKFIVCLGICLIVAAIYFFTTGKQTTSDVADSSPQTAPELVTFTDALGQELTLARPKRVVSLMGSFTEIWLLAGGRDTLVGTAVDTQDKRDLGLPETVLLKSLR